MIYLDTAATTKPKAEVVEAMMPYFTEKWHNPSSLYGDATNVKQDIESARKTVADYIGAKADEVFFTSSGSESNCWAIQGFVNYWLARGMLPVVITTPIEHKSIMACVENLNNVDVHYVKVDEYGVVDLQSLEDLLHKHRNMIFNGATLVSVQAANNEIGTIQSIKKIAKIVHKYDAVFHTDATQAFGQLLIDVNDCEIDMMTASGHKIGAPKGVGFLYKHENVLINPLIYGSQMDYMRGGTENVPYIIGMAKAVELCQKNHVEKIYNLLNVRDYAIAKLKAKFDCRVNGNEHNRLPNNINITFNQNITGEGLLYMLDMSEIQVSTGSACNSTSIEPSHVLKAIGLTDEEANKTIRITISEDTKHTNIDYLISEIDKAIKVIEV